MIAKLKLYAAMAGAFVVALVGWKLVEWGRSIEQAKAAAKQVKDAKTVQQERSKAEGMGPKETDKEFDKWLPKD